MNAILYKKNKILGAVLVCFLLALCIFSIALNVAQATSTSAVHVQILPLCGNTIVEPGEQCDGTSLAGQSCTTQGFSGGTLSCNASCSFVTSACVSVPSAPTNLAATVEDSSIDLSWSAPSGDGGSALTDYVVEYKLTSGSTWSVFIDGVNTTQSTTVTGLSNGNAYDFRVSAKNSTGEGPASGMVSAAPGAPAQVIIQSFSSVATPIVSALVRITNEGLTPYEYTYTWCVTNSVSNLCGGGDDVFSSTAAKLIQPGANFDTVLNSTVSVAGNYWLHLNVQFGSDSSGANQSFTATSTTATTGSTSSGGGGGGGGGGGLTTSSTLVTEEGNCIFSGDFNCDGKVNSVDFSIMLSFWKTSPPFKNPRADINKDGKVNSVDFSIMLSEWGRTVADINNAKQYYA